MYYRVKDEKFPWTDEGLVNAESRAIQMAREQEFPVAVEVISHREDGTIWKSVRSVADIHGGLQSAY